MRFLNQRRLRVYPRIVVVLALLWWGVWILAGDGLADPRGEAIGGDFVTFYAASDLALAGRPADAYDETELHAAEQNAVEGERDRRLWSYPPPLYLLAVPLATLPYLAAFIAWALLMTALYIMAARAIAPIPNVGWLAAASGGFLVCILNGQTGILIATALAAGLLLLPRNQYAGGAILGFVALKPQMALLVPVAILVGRHWRAIAPGVAVAALVSVASLAVLGRDTWAAFLDGAGQQIEYFEEGRWGYSKMPTVEAAALLLESPVWLARALQAISGVGAAAAVAWLWAGASPYRLKCAGLAFGALLATPYGYDYDMAVSGVGLAFLGMEAHENGWLRWEKEGLLMGYLLPFLLVPIATVTNVQLGPLGLAVLLALSVRRARVRGRDKSIAVERAPAGTRRGRGRRRAEVRDSSPPWEQ